MAVIFLSDTGKMLIKDEDFQREEPNLSEIRIGNLQPGSVTGLYQII
jgi:hypothetical protein